ncbi:hypothetical protein AX14_006963 [Amanita brunnescens Koide BX004]|nr:hypothetical protein AX14_006963 [Amanita brunnescens Koide BX004]
MNSLSGSDKLCHLLYGLHRFLAFWVSQTHSWGTTVQAAAGFPTATRNCNFENASFCLPDPPPACRTLKHAEASIAGLPAISINVTDGAALEAEAAVQGQTHVVMTSYGLCELDALAKKARIVVMTCMPSKQSATKTRADQLLQVKYFLSHRDGLSAPITLSVTNSLDLLADFYSLCSTQPRSTQFYSIPEAETVLAADVPLWLDSSLTWADAMNSVEDSRERTLVSRVKEIFRFPNKSESTRIVSWIGLFANNKASSRASGLLDTLCAKLEFMKYDEGERDLVTQVDRGVARWRGANITSTLEGKEKYL